MPCGFWVGPSSVLCLLCNGVAAGKLDDVAHCARCGSGYCRNCVALGETSLSCAGDPADCPLRLAPPDPPAPA
jgi:hypothetical protein